MDTSKYLSDSAETVESKRRLSKLTPDAQDSASDAVLRREDLTLRIRAFVISAR